jgi:hypothetical protein
MSKEAGAECPCVIDCAGLHAIASDMSDNLKTTILHYLATGVIAVPTCAWQEFEEAYDDEAAELVEPQCLEWSTSAANLDVETRPQGVGAARGYLHGQTYGR